MILIIFFVKEEKLFWPEFGFTFDKLVEVMLAKLLLSQSQARSKHKVTGGAEQVALVNSPPRLRSVGESVLLGECQITTFVYNTFCSCL